MSTSRKDMGFTHVALVVSEMERSIDFYGTFARMQVVHRRAEDGFVVAWLSDLTRPFVLVLAQGPTREPGLGPFAHLGVACESRDEVDRLADVAAGLGCLRSGPTDSGYPVGYWAFLSDPDGHTVELSFGQDVGLKVAEASGAGTMTPVEGDAP